MLHLQLNDKYDLGGQFFLWEFATAVASYFLKINPFDQPNVESAKVMARKMVAKYEETGKLPPANFAPLTKASLIEFLGDPAIDPSTAQATPDRTGRGYISLQAYVTPSPEARAVLQQIRLKLRDPHVLGPRIAQIHRMRVALAAIADDYDFLRFDQIYVGITIIIDPHGRTPFVLGLSC